MKIRTVNEGDAPRWAEMRHELWPDSVVAHMGDIGNYFAGATDHMVEVFVLDRHADG